MTREAVGTLAEEAAKLISALSSMSFSEREGDGTGADTGHDTGRDTRRHDRHDDDHDPLSPECRYCPICSLGRAARSVTPEVREHLASAAMSLVLALKGFLDEAASEAAADPAVEKIDLAED
jgi:hypothetical protein